jgi:hypothetical protein
MQAIPFPWYTLSILLILLLKVCRSVPQAIATARFYCGLFAAGLDVSLALAV